MASSSTTGRVVGSRGMQGLSGFLSGPRAFPNDSSIPTTAARYQSYLPRPSTPEQVLVRNPSPATYPNRRTVLKDVEDSSSVFANNRLHDNFHTPTVTTEQPEVEVLVTPPPDPPLLLEGDEFYVSHDGVAHTFYELGRSYASTECQPFAVEELYDLEGAKKMFVLRKEPNQLPSMPLSHGSQEVLSLQAEGLARLGEPLTSFELHEIDHGVFGSAGTGSTTWESSIVMAMYFSMHPELLHGDVIELGSGVGLGGIMSQVPHPPEMNSITLTDYNLEVLGQCEQNIQQAQAASQIVGTTSVQVGELNWYDFADGTEDSTSKKKYARQYDTVLASDCAYLYPDLVALSHTMEQLVRQNYKSQVHIFGPCNRGALLDLIMLLRDKRKMNVIVEELEINRYRLKPPKSKAGFGLTSNIIRDSYDECPFASKNLAKFLHITASFQHPAAAKEQMEDID